MRNTAQNNDRTADARVWFALLGGIAGCLFAGRLDAHDTWILPSRARVSPGREIVFDLTSGMAFPANEVGVKADRLAHASSRLGETVSELIREPAGEKALRLKARFSKPGIAAVWVESKPRALELKPDEVKEYLEEIGAWDSIGRRWESEGGGRWRESYTKHAKTYVRIGRPQRDDSWDRPVGMDLELVPESDPTQLGVGKEFSVRLLENGQAVSDVAIGLVASNSKPESLSRTDSKGRIRLRFDRGGWWLIRATVLKPSAKPDFDWESRFTTLTVFVSAR
jgi:uncharacterized GH25 family protein